MYTLPKIFILSLFLIFLLDFSNTIAFSESDTNIDCSELRVFGTEVNANRKLAINLLKPKNFSVVKVVLDDKFEIPSFGNTKNVNKAFYIESGDILSVCALPLYKIPQKISIVDSSGNECYLQQNKIIEEGY